MKKMKMGLALVMAALICMPLAALAEAAPESAVSASVTANGVVESENVCQVTAPFSGVLLPFDWDLGDSVEAGETLFELDTAKVYSPVDGVVSAVFAEKGDLCEDTVSLYGMIASIEKRLDQIAECSTSGAYNDEENRLIHVGETVYFEQSNDKDNEGEGRVISVNGSDYVVELTAGDFENGDGIKLYRDEKMGTKSCIGSGTIARAADVAVMGSGRVLRCAVSEGQQVKKGQLLFELASQDAAVEVESAEIEAPQAGALELAQLVSGQQVYKGQLLARIHDLTALQVVAEVDEMDLDRVHTGDSLVIELDRYPGEQLTGTVTEIAQIGKAKQNATYYDVTISFTTSLEVLPGMNATVWLPAQN